MKVVGKLKGLVRVTETQQEPLLDKKLMEQLMNPKKYKIRFYALKAYKLAPMDMGQFLQFI